MKTSLIFLSDTREINIKTLYRNCLAMPEVHRFRTFDVPRMENRYLSYDRNIVRLVI